MSGRAAPEPCVGLERALPHPGGRALPHPGGFPLGRTFWLLVLMVEDHVGGVAQAPSQVDQGAVSKLVDLEDAVIDVSDTINVVFEHIDAEGVT